MMVENETNYPPPKKNKIINYINHKTKEQGKALDKKAGGKTFGAINIGHLQKKVTMKVCMVQTI